MKDDQPEFNFFEGRRRGDEGMSRAESTALGRIWCAKNTVWFDQQESGMVFSSDDCVRANGLPGTPGNKAIGSWFRTMSRAKKIICVNDMHQSGRVRRHGGLQRLWMKV